MLIYFIDLIRRPLARLCRRAAWRLSPPLTVWDVHVVVDNDLITVVVGDHLAAVEMDPGEALEASNWFRHAASAATGWGTLRAAGLRCMTPGAITVAEERN